MDLELNPDPDLNHPPPKIDLSLVLKVIKTLDGSSCKKCIYN